MINGKQCDIVWYINDNKISHIDGAVVWEVISMIEGRFGKMTVTRGINTLSWGWIPNSRMMALWTSKWKVILRKP